MKSSEKFSKLKLCTICLVQLARAWEQLMKQYTLLGLFKKHFPSHPDYAEAINNILWAFQDQGGS